MDALFLAVTGLSLLLVIVMAVVVARMLREDRRRSDARVAALMAMADHPPRAAAPPEAPAARAASPLARDHDDELQLRPEDAAPEAPTMFAAPARSQPWGRRMAIITPLALILLGAGLAFYPSAEDIGAPAQAAATPSEHTGTAMPLELLSLRHTQQADTLTVMGLVQNPRTGAPLSRVIATAFVFAADGSLLASGRAPLDFTTLSPGDESPFVVTVPVKGEVSRYRIGFRGEDGRVIAHVDRRANAAVARASEKRP